MKSLKWYVLCIFVVSVICNTINAAQDSGQDRVTWDRLDQFSDEVPDPQGIIERLKHATGWEKGVSERMQAFQSLKTSTMTQGAFYFTKGKQQPFIGMHLDIQFYLNADIETQKSYLLFLYHQFHAMVSLKGGEHGLLGMLNKCFLTPPGRDARKLPSREFMDLLIGQKAASVLADGNLSDLNRKRIDLLNKYFNKGLVDELFEYLEKESRRILAEVEAMKKIAAKGGTPNESDENYQKRQATAYNKAEKAMFKELRRRLKDFDGVNTGLVQSDDAIGIDKQVDFTLEEMVALKREMEAIESIPTSASYAYGKTLKHAVIGAAVAGAAGYALYKFQPDAFEVGRKFVMETCPTAASLVASRTASAASYLFGGVRSVGSYFGLMSPVVQEGSVDVRKMLEEGVTKAIGGATERISKVLQVPIPTLPDVKLPAIQMPTFVESTASAIGRGVAEQAPEALEVWGGRFSPVAKPLGNALINTATAVKAGMGNLSTSGFIP